MIPLEDLKMWLELNREPWISAEKEVKRLEKNGAKIKAKWGERGEIIINGKSFK